MADYLEYLKKKLLKYDRNSIITTKHAFQRINQRQLNQDEIIEIILNSTKLRYVIRQDFEHGEKFECFYDLNVRHSLVCIIAFNGDARLVSVFKIKKSRQKKLEQSLSKHNSIRNLR